MTLLNRTCNGEMHDEEFHARLPACRWRHDWQQDGEVGDYDGNEENHEKRDLRRLQQLLHPREIELQAGRHHCAGAAINLIFHNGEGIIMGEMYCTTPARYGRRYICRGLHMNFKIIPTFVDVQLKWFYFSAWKHAWNYFTVIILEACCSSRIFSKMLNVAETIVKWFLSGWNNNYILYVTCNRGFSDIRHAVHTLRTPRPIRDNALQCTTTCSTLVIIVTIIVRNGWLAAKMGLVPF